jgi:peptide/nickel transport system substrate-binding protein
VSLPKSESEKTRVPKFIAILFAVFIGVAGLLTACTSQTITPTINPAPIATEFSTDFIPQDNPTTESTTPTPAKEVRQLTICTGAEPASLFPFGSLPAPARSILQALYDGPLDQMAFTLQPVILEQVPSLENGGAYFEPVQVSPGDAIIDNAGNLVNLEAGTIYRPSECSSPSCAQVYSGQDTILMDSLVVRFHLLPDIRWSDGVPLGAEDSHFAYQVAQALYPAYRPQIVNVTQSYRVIDQRIIEWRGLPGSQDPKYAEFFFAPLPKHAWETIPMSELPESETASQSPLGWGPYMFEKWTPGEQIVLSKNPHYFRADEGLPHFDRLVFHFTDNPQESVQALLAGECQLADETALRGIAGEDLQLLQSNESIATWVTAGGAWEQILFGITSIDPTRPALFASAQVRQAIVSCIDRKRISQEVYSGLAVLTDAFVLPDHPLYTSESAQYVFDPQVAASMLTASGWVDHDSNPATPRVASGVPGVPEGTLFEFTYLASDEADRQQAARIVQESLALCGVKANLEFGAAAQIYAGGPEGPVFGRQFDLAQLAWTAFAEVPCSLFTSAEIPGPYPAFPKGWGGANASGYSNLNFDQACATSLTTLQSSPEFAAGYQQIQLILSEDIPAFPLYLHIRSAAARADLCNFQVEPSNPNSLWNLEELDYGNSCIP